MKHKRPQRIQILTALAASLAHVTAAPGSLDTGFNSSGLATADYGGTEVANAVTVAPDGKIVVAGSVFPLGEGEGFTFAARYNADGSVDPSFGGDGGVTDNTGIFSDDYATAVAVQADEKVIVGGYSYTSEDQDLVIVRYLANGTLDPSFGEGGKVISRVSSSNDELAALAIQSDGKILLAGTSHVPNNPDFAITRLNADGSVDETFGSGGLVELDFQGNDHANALSIQPDGKIVVAGYTGPGLSINFRISPINVELPSFDFAVARLNPDGSLDTTFDSDGMRTQSLGADDRATGVAIQKDGKIIVSGTSDADSADFAIVRYTASGDLDTSFSGDGIKIIDLGADDSCQSIVLQKDGKILLGGSTDAVDETFDWGIVRIGTDGSLDRTFGDNGKLILDLGGADLANAMALQQDGRLLVAGNTDGDLALARLNTLVRTDARVGRFPSTPEGNDIYNTSGSGQVQTVNLKAATRKRTLFVKIENDGHDVDSFKIDGSKGNPDFEVKYISGNTDVTSAVTAGTFSTGDLAPGAGFKLKVRISAKTTKAGEKIDLRIKGTSDTDSSSKDAVKIKATAR